MILEAETSLLDCEGWEDSNAFKLETRKLEHVNYYHDINSYHLPFQSINKSTGLYTVGITYEMLNKLTIKKLDTACDCLYKYDKLIKNLNELDDDKKDSAFCNIIYDTCDLFIYMLIKRSRIIKTTYCEKENLMLIHKGSLYENAILCLSHCFIGNENLYYEFNSMHKKG